MGNGFFTMKHKFADIRDALNKVYSEFDSFSVFSLVFDEIERLNLAFHENFFTFTSDLPQRRLERKESDLIYEFWMRYDLSKLHR